MKINMLRIVLAGLLLLIRQTQGWSLVTTRKVHVGTTEPELKELAQVYSTEDEYRLNDPDVGLTALKDKKLKSCFVNDYDPLWNPAESDKKEIIDNQPCEKVNTKTDLQTLRRKAGSKIADMCMDLYVFWLAESLMEPPMLPDVYQKESRHCKFDDDLSLTEGGSSQGGSGLQSFPDTHEVAPPMLPVGPDTNYKEGQPPAGQEKAPPTIGDGAPPMIGDGAPPMIGDGAQPMIGDGAPPMIGDGPPPMLGNNAQPMSLDGAPPMLRDLAAPLTQGGAPPMMQGGAPPMTQGGAPPMMQGGSPPMMQGATSNDGPPPMITPLVSNSHSRRDLDEIKEQVTQKRPSPVTLADMLKKVKLTPVPTPDMKTPPPPRGYM